jgi:hypothetical protein
MMQLYKICKSHFYGRLAEAMNSREDLPPEYVPLTVDKVKTKFKKFGTSGTLLFSYRDGICPTPARSLPHSCSLIIRFVC